MILNKRMFLFFISAVFLLPAFSQNAKVTFTKGTVAVFRAEKWLDLNVGDYLQESDVVSTGFQSELKINCNGSVMSLAPLTRMTFDEMKFSGSNETVSAFLNVGAVRTKVNHSSGKKISYSVKTPDAVVSARGTDFMVTGNGSVFCYEGAVSVCPNFENKNKNRRKNKTRELENIEKKNVENEEEIFENDSSASPAKKAAHIFAATPAETVVLNKNRNISMAANGRPESVMKTSINQIYKPLFSVSTAADSEKMNAISVKSWEEKDKTLRNFGNHNKTENSISADIETKN